MSLPLELSGVGVWFEDYSGTLSFFTTFVLVLVTWRYVSLTHALSENAEDQLAEAVKSRLDEQMPNVSNVVETSLISRSGEDLLAASINLHNDGPAPAIVSLELDTRWIHTVPRMPHHEINLLLKNGDESRLLLEARPPELEQGARYTALGFYAFIHPLVAEVSDEYHFVVIYDHASRSISGGEGVDFMEHRKREYPRIGRERRPQGETRGRSLLRRLERRIPNRLRPSGG